MSQLTNNMNIFFVICSNRFYSCPNYLSILRNQEMTKKNYLLYP